MFCLRATDQDIIFALNHADDTFVVASTNGDLGILLQILEGCLVIKVEDNTKRTQMLMHRFLARKFDDAGA